MSKSLLRSVCLSSFGALLLGLTACGSLDQGSRSAISMIKPYKIDIVQGNFVSREQAAALKEGMSRMQVRDLLGTPLLTSIFHADRWDYVFTFNRQGVTQQARHVTVFFKGDVLSRVEADELPSEAEFAASLDSGRHVGKVPVLEMSPEQLQASATAPQPAASKALPSLPASYPPLEGNAN